MTKLPSTIAPLTDVLFIILSVSISFFIVLTILEVFNSPCQSDESVAIGNIGTIVGSQKTLTQITEESQAEEKNLTMLLLPHTSPPAF